MTLRELYGQRIISSYFAANKDRVTPEQPLVLLTELLTDLRGWAEAAGYVDFDLAVELSAIRHRYGR